MGGYPKSGTTWICRMFAHYLALPWFNMNDLIIGFNGVMHHHWIYHPSLAGTIYVMRDGRDVMVSVYMNMVKGYMARSIALNDLGNRSAMNWLGSNLGRFATISKRFRYLYGKQFDPLNVTENLPKFVDAELEDPFIVEAKLPWHLHIRDWLDNSESVTFVKYEDMLDDAQSSLALLISQYADVDLNETDLTYTTGRFSFKRMTGRNPGEESRTSFARKGIRGDWRNYFNIESRKIFNEYAGDLLIELGYERDDQWV